MNEMGGKKQLDSIDLNSERDIVIRQWTNEICISSSSSRLSNRIRVCCPSFTYKPYPDSSL